MHIPDGYLSPQAFVPLYGSENSGGIRGFPFYRDYSILHFSWLSTIFLFYKAFSIRHIVQQFEIGLHADLMKNLIKVEPSRFRVFVGALWIIKLHYSRIDAMRTSGRNFIFYANIALVNYQNNPTLPASSLNAE
jgi:hypothetical protein